MRWEVSPPIHDLAGEAGRPSSQLSIILGKYDAWNLLLNKLQLSECLYIACQDLCKHQIIT